MNQKPFLQRFYSYFLLIYYCLIEKVDEIFVELAQWLVSYNNIFHDFPQTYELTLLNNLNLRSVGVIGSTPERRDKGLFKYLGMNLFNGNVILLAEDFPALLIEQNSFVVEINDKV